MEQLADFFHVDEALVRHNSSVGDVYEIENPMISIQGENPMDGPNIVMALFDCTADDGDELAFKVRSYTTFSLRT